MNRRSKTRIIGCVMCIPMFWFSKDINIFEPSSFGLVLMIMKAFCKWLRGFNHRLQMIGIHFYGPVRIHGDKQQVLCNKNPLDLTWGRFIASHVTWWEKTQSTVSWKELMLAHSKTKIAYSLRFSRVRSGRHSLLIFFIVYFSLRNVLSCIHLKDNWHCDKNFRLSWVHCKHVVKLYALDLYTSCLCCFIKKWYVAHKTTHKERGCLIISRTGMCSFIKKSSIDDSNTLLPHRSFNRLFIKM